MKTLTLLFSLSTLGAMAQIPNGSFESWHVMGDLLEPDEWVTSNWITSMSGTSGAEQGSPAPVGSHFLSLTTAAYLDGAMPGFAMISFAYAGRPDSFDGLVRYSTVTGDPAQAVVFLTRWDAVAEMEDVIGAAEMEWTGDMDWQSFSMPFEYYDEVMPDSAHIILLSSSAGEPVPGNQAGFDDLKFHTITLDIHERALNGLYLFPVPAANTISISADDHMRELGILNAVGSVVATYPVNGAATTVDVTGLTSGVYFARVILSDGTTAVHRFVKE